MSAVIDIPPVTILICIFFVLLFLFVTIVAVLYYSGMFYQPTVARGAASIGRAKLAYKFIIAPYDGTVVGSTFTEITSIAPKLIPVGIFYDNPETTPAHQLRSVIGVVVEDSEHPTMEDCLKDLLVKQEFKFHDLPPVSEAVTSEFPYRSPFSIWFAASRVYPLLNQFIKDNELTAYPMLEVYKDCKIHYMVPLDHQDSFFVPDYQESERLIAASASGSDAEAVVATDNEENESAESDSGENDSGTESESGSDSENDVIDESPSTGDVKKEKKGVAGDVSSLAKSGESGNATSAGGDKKTTLPTSLSSEDKDLLASFEVVPEE